MLALTSLTPHNPYQIWNIGHHRYGLIGLVKTAAREWGPQNIRVNLLLPGWQKTDLTEGIFPEGSGWLDHALRRPPASEEMAGTVVHLAQLNDISGQVWNCDSRHL
ncbi:MAG: SDR family oxidoreductase [Nitrospira sp.]|nr:SDR family oxidoreductase [Nitrospira sp.]